MNPSRRPNLRPRPRRLLPSPSASPVPSQHRGRWILLLASFIWWMFDGVERQGCSCVTARPAPSDGVAACGKTHIAHRTAVLVACLPDR